MRILPLFVSAIALLLGLIHLAVDWTDSGEREVAALKERVDVLSSELEDLRVATRANAMSLQRLGSGAARPSSIPTPAQLGAAAAAPGAAGGAVAAPPVPAPTEEARRTFLDRGRPASERVDALLNLRKLRDGRNEEVARAALDLAQDASVAAPLRRDALRHLSRLDYPSMKDPLIGILTRERDSNTRTEAVELLQRFLDDPAVKTALQAAKNDPDRRVREEARQRLADWESRQGQK